MPTTVAVARPAWCSFLSCSFSLYLQNTVLREMAQERASRGQTGQPRPMTEQERRYQEHVAAQQAYEARQQEELMMQQQLLLLQPQKFMELIC